MGKVTITLNADWISTASDADLRWLLARAERYGWEVRVASLQREVVKRETY
jgi:hypothetical protein